MPFKATTGQEPARPGVKPKGPVQVNSKKVSSKSAKPVQLGNAKSIKHRLVKGGMHY